MEVEVPFTTSPFYGKRQFVMYILTNVSMRLRLPEGNYKYVASWATAKGADVKVAGGTGFSIWDSLEVAK